MPTLSIVTLSFNQAAFLPHCLESVSGQLYPADEHLCIDPGSTDDSRAILSAQAKENTRLFFEPDAGPGDGLNRGFTHAKGDVLGFLNADDEFSPGALEFVRTFFANHPDIDMLVGAVRFIDARGRPDWRKRISTVPDTLDLAAGSYRFYQQGFFFRRRVWDLGVRFNVANRTCWDLEFFVDACLNGANARSSSRELGRFRLHGASLTGSGANVSAYRNDYRRIAAKAAAVAGVTSGSLVWRRLWRKIDPRPRLQEILP